jgi:microcystin-dependent protein
MSFASATFNISPNAGDNGSALIPTGSIINFGGSTAPSGWLICNGAAVSRTLYTSLFGVIGTTYGAGDGSTTFNIPNTAGRMVRGVGTASWTGLGGGTASTTIVALGGSGGADGTKVSVDNLPQHRHGYNIAAGGGYASADGSNGNRAAQTQNYTNSGQTYEDGSLTLATNSNAPTLNAYVGINYIIKFS